MKTLTNYLITLLLIISFFSCTKNSIDDKLEYALMIVDQDKTYALALIDSIELINGTLDTEQYHKFVLYKTIIRDKNSLDISNDTILQKVLNYYIQKKDLHKIALSHLAIARVYEGKENVTEAIANYLKAEVAFEKYEFPKIKGLLQYYIGNNYLKQKLFDQAIFRYKKSIEYFKTTDDINSIFTVYFNIANGYAYKGILDSAIIQYDDCLVQLDTIKNQRRDLFYKIKNNLGVLYQMKNDTVLSEKNYLEALTFANNKVDSGKVYMYLADLKMNENPAKEVNTYIDKAFQLINKENGEDPEDLILHSEILRAKINYAESHRDYKGALKISKEFENFQDKIFERNISNKILTVEKKYNLTLLQSHNKQLIINKQKLQIYFLILFIILLFVILFFYLMNRIYKNEISDTRMKIKYLNRIIEENDNSISTQIMHKYFNILTKTILIGGYLQEKEQVKEKKLLAKFNEVVYGKDAFDWDTFYEIFNKLNDNIFNKMKNTFTYLNEEELKLCCLAYCNVRNIDISIMLRISINTVKTKKYLLRKRLNLGVYSNFKEEVNIKLSSSLE
jgi:tetratricopeptide (TPR) repeat protein